MNLFVLFQPHLHEIVNRSMELACTSKEPYNYFLLLRALFRSIGGGNASTIATLTVNYLRGEGKWGPVNLFPGHWGYTASLSPQWRSCQLLCRVSRLRKWFMRKSQKYMYMYMQKLTYMYKLHVWVQKHTVKDFWTSVPQIYCCVMKWVP